MREETVAFPNRRGLQMVGTLLAPEGQGPLPAVLVVHGFRGNRSERHIVAVADALAHAGFFSLRVDLTNNLGDSQGEFRRLTVSQSLEDVQDALAYLQGRTEADPERLGLTGHSFGGMLAAITAARTPAIKSLVTLSAVFDMPEKLAGFLGEEQVRGWQERGSVEMDPPGSALFLDYGFYEDLQRYDVAAEVGRLRAPVRIIQGEADTGVTVEDAQGYHVHAGSPQKELVLVPGADHAYSSDMALMQVCLYTADWFRHTLGVAGGQRE
ncbi:MAG: alpha/beta fold hydrolase [Chloroflexi bacterium]|nr:alpha/beta fold hydrolase [Chloroflexota bacterium]